MDPLNSSDKPQSMPNVLTPKKGVKTVTPPGTPGGLSPHPGHGDHLAAIRTYSSDLAEAVREKGGSIVRIAVAENERHVREHTEATKSRIGFIIGTIIFLLIAAGAIFAIYYHNKQAALQAPIPTVVAPSSLLSAESSQTIDITGQAPADILNSIQGIVSNPDIQEGTLKNIVITETDAGVVTRIPAADFLTTLKMHTPPDLLRALDKQYMLGVYLYTSSNLVLVLHGSAHDFLLSGMLAWEPNLYADMAPLFNIPTTVFDPAANPTTFTDTLIENRDARAVLDGSKKPVLFYSFIDPDTIVIATDPKTLTEAVKRSTS